MLGALGQAGRGSTWDGWSGTGAVSVCPFSEVLLLLTVEQLWSHGAAGV